jgi:hypothetical protein
MDEKGVEHNGSDLDDEDDDDDDDEEDDEVIGSASLCEAMVVVFGVGADGACDIGTVVVG